MKMKMMTALSAVALAIGFSAGPAAAATDITRPGSCSVSANWSIALSVNYNNTSGSPSTGTPDYAVMNSPGPLKTSLGSSLIYAHDANGNIVTQGFTTWVRDTSKPGYVYRSDANNATSGIRYVQIDPESNTGVDCSDYSSAANIYSAN